MFKKEFSRQITEVSQRQSKYARKMPINGTRKPIESRQIKRLRKQRPKRYMNPFLLFAQESRKNAYDGNLLPQWKAAHKGLGGKWRASGSERKIFKKVNVPPFAGFIKECPQ